jgi:hypothetical protein
MQKHVGWLWIVGSFGLVAAAIAQTASPPAPNTQLDGTYAFVSGTKLNESYINTPMTHVCRCLEYKCGPLAIVNGQARYMAMGGTSGTDYQVEGTVGPQRELSMRLQNMPGNRVGSPPIEIIVNGSIDYAGTVRARQTGWWCQYDLIWQKQSK